MALLLAGAAAAAPVGLDGCSRSGLGYTCPEGSVIAVLGSSPLAVASDGGELDPVTMTLLGKERRVTHRLTLDPGGARSDLFLWREQGKGAAVCATTATDAVGWCAGRMDAALRAGRELAAGAGALEAVITLGPRGCVPRDGHSLGCPDGSWLDFLQVTPTGRPPPGVDPTRLALDEVVADARTGAPGSAGPCRQRIGPCALLGGPATCAEVGRDGQATVAASPSFQPDAVILCSGPGDPATTLPSACRDVVTFTGP